MSSKGQHTIAEISSQPDAWIDALQAFAAIEGELLRAWASLNPRQVVFVGCGSTYYLSQAAAFLFQRLTGVPARAYPSSEIVLFSPYVLPEPNDTLLVAVSRSGMTSETLSAVSRFRQRGGTASWAITCYPESPLAQVASLVLLARAAQEESVAQTRSFTSMLLLAQALTATMARDTAMMERLRGLPRILRDLIGRVGELPERLGTDLDIERIFFLGNGPLYGVASEAMLKTKEMSLSHSEAYHPLEFRHGPMSMVNKHTLVVGLLSDSGLAEELRVLEEMQGLGARILALVEDDSALDAWRPDHVIELRSSLQEWERGLLCLPVLQRLAYHRALAKGLDPDRPNHLTAVVRL
jgi:glucosamine--fructose-6-phosphate aminotransferase (isomerizing)